MTEGTAKRRGSPGAIAALVSAALGAGCLHLYLERYEEDVRGGEMVPVLSLVRDVAPGTLLDADLLDVRRIPERYLDERHVPMADLERVEGNRVQVGLVAGDALLWTDLGVADGVARLSELVPVGRRAVRIGGGEVSFGGLLRPGDRVDVLITEASALGERQPPRTWTLLENVIVLAVGDELSAEEGQRGARGDAVTLSVLPSEAQRFESHRRRGSFRLALRNPQDLTLAHGAEASGAL